MQWESFRGVFVPQPDPPSRCLPLGWNVGPPAPKDRPIEVIAPPHNNENTPRVAFWDENKPYAGVWRFRDHKGGLMVPIVPIAWREIQEKSDG